MKNFNYFFLFIFLYSCTSNTIFEKPKDLIPKDTMVHLIEDMMIASTARHTKNILKEQNIRYMAFVYDKYKIDSVRFQSSNFYYTTKIDLYEEIINEVKTNLEKKRDYYKKIKKRLDSIKKDSLKKVRNTKLIDTIKGFGVE